VDFVCTIGIVDDQHLGGLILVWSSEVKWNKIIQ